MIGIRGGSYGGYVVLGMITEYPDLFSAAIDIVGIANFKTFLQNTAAYRRALREAEYGPLSDPEFLDSISPIHKANLIKTPLLVVHGANDPRVPVDEARQILAAVAKNGTYCRFADLRQRRPRQRQARQHYRRVPQARGILRPLPQRSGRGEEGRLTSGWGCNPSEVRTGIRMEKQVITKLHKRFEDCAHETDGVEYWYARELQGLLGYDHWKNFERIVSKAKTACENAAQIVADHFADVGKMVDIGSNTQRDIADIMLTRYACYLVAQNGDPRKDEIAFAMTYFAVQTRKQELLEERLAQWERLRAREELTVSEKTLSGVLFERGVDNQGFARIRSKGDSALFAGFSTQEMKERLGIPLTRPLADFLPGVTVKAKDLANEITSHNIRQDKAMHGEDPIAAEHVKNNENMREMLTKSGIRPETLPPEEDIKKLERRFKSEDKKLPKSVKKLKGK